MDIQHGLMTVCALDAERRLVKMLCDCGEREVVMTNDHDTYAHRMQLIAIQTTAACAERNYWELKLKILKWKQADIVECMAEKEGEAKP